MPRRSATIIRAPHDNLNPYKSVRRATFEDSSLTFEARGALAYLLMKPDDWQINIGDLMREGGIGRDKTYKIIGELMACGYLERVDDRDKGKFGGATYLLYESPLPEKPDTVTPLPDLPDTTKPDTTKPYPVNQEQTNKEKTTKYENSTKEGAEGESAPPRTPRQEMYAAVCEAIGWDRKVIGRKDQERAADTVIALKEAGYSVDDVRRFMTEIWFHGWQWEKDRQWPTLAQLRQEIGKLRAGVPENVPRSTRGNGTSKVAASLSAVDEYYRRKAGFQGGEP